MRIEYKVKFEQDGLVISQSIEPDSQGGLRQAQSLSTTKAVVKEPPEGKAGEGKNPLATKANDLGGGVSGPPTDTGTKNVNDEGGGGPIPGGVAPIFILGPIVFAPPSQNGSTASQDGSRAVETHNYEAPAANQMPAANHVSAAKKRPAAKRGK